MKLLNFRRLVFVSTIFFMSGCTSNQNIDQAKVVENFSDKGYLLDSLKDVYRFEAISFDKVKDVNVTDSTFSIDFVNAKILPRHSDNNIDNKQLNDIVIALKRTLKNAERYNSYQIIFIKSDKSFGLSFKTNQIVHIVLNRQL
jgi:hypothetical protein